MVGVRTSATIARAGRARRARFDGVCQRLVSRHRNFSQGVPETPGVAAGVPGARGRSSGRAGPEATAAGARTTGPPEP